jgi:hypothetical protein
MALAGQAKAEYMREYHRRRKAGAAKVHAATRSFCDEPGGPDRLLVGDVQDATICEACIGLAVARIAEARGQ